MDNKTKFAEVYTQAFIDSYPEFPAEKSANLIMRAVATATSNIRSVAIDGKAFKLTAKRLGIKHTYTAFEAFLNGKEA